MAVIFYFYAWKLSDLNPKKGHWVWSSNQSKKVKWNRQKQKHSRGEKKKTEVESRVLQRDTPFLDRLGFGGGTGRRGSCACVRVPLWSFRKTNQKQTKKPKRKHRGATFERSRTDTVDNEKASEEQFINDKPVSSDAQQWEQVEVKRLNHLQIALGVERRKQKQSVSSMLLGGFIPLTTGTLWLVFSRHLRENTVSDWKVMVEMALVATQCTRIHETWDSLWFCFNLDHLKPTQLQTRLHFRANVMTKWY